MPLSPLLWEAFDQAPAFVAVLRGSDHVYEYTNRAYRQMLGFRDLLGRPVREAVPELAGQGFLELLGGVFATGEPFVGKEFPITFQPTPEDLPAQRYVDFVYQPLVESRGTVAGILVQGIDVTDRVLVHRELIEREERLRLVSHATNDAIWDWDMRTDRFVANPAFGELFGWREQAAAGFDNDWMVERMHPDDRAQAFGTFLAVVESGGSSWQGEHRFERADGTWADVLERGYIVRENGVPVRTVGSMIDISARKAAERALLEAKVAAEAVARDKSSLLRNMSHEIRTPLTAVIGYAELLIEEAPPDLMDLVVPIERGGKRLLDTLNSVLDLAQIEAGARPLATVPVDLGAEVQASVAALRSLAQAKGLALDVVAPPTPAMADRAALDRVLTNLVGNAIKFTFEGRVAVEVWAEGASAYVRVADTGVGIEPAFLPHVFDDFRQESSGANRSHEGSGLGLTITRGLVTMMGGEISVASEKGIGSVFTVRLPAA